MRTSELRAIEEARPHSDDQKRKHAPRWRPDHLHREVVGLFSRFGEVDLEDGITHARGQRRIA